MAHYISDWDCVNNNLFDKNREIEEGEKVGENILVYIIYIMRRYYDYI